MAKLENIMARTPAPKTQLQNLMTAEDLAAYLGRSVRTIRHDASRAPPLLLPVQGMFLGCCEESHPSLGLAPKPSPLLVAKFGNKEGTEADNSNSPQLSENEQRSSAFR